MKKIPKKILDLIPIYYFEFLGIKIRVRKLAFKGGWISEYQKKGFFKNKWIALNKYNGLKEAFPSSSIEDAKNAILENLKQSLNRSS